MLLVAFLVTTLVAGCGIAGPLGGVSSSVIAPLLVLVGLTTFLAGCGSGIIGYGRPRSIATTASPSPGSVSSVGLKFVVQPTKSGSKAEAFTAIAPAPQVAVVDESGNTVTTSTAPITISLGANPGGAVLTGATTVNAVNGVATFSDLRISRAGSGYTLVASSDALTADTSVTFVVTPLAPVFRTAAARRDFANGQVDSGSEVDAQAKGDFNHDGNPDIAVAAYYGSVVTVLLGDGTGGFSTPLAAASTQGPFDLTAADFNGDGDDDLVCTQSNTPAVLVFQGNGDGTFKAPVNLLVTGTPFGVVTGDFNDDGKRDIATTVPASANGSVAVLLGNGDGTFGAPYYSGPASLAVKYVTVGRFNADAIDDLAMAESNGLLTMLGQGNGLFVAASTVPVSVAPTIDCVATTLGVDTNQSVVMSDAGGKIWSLLGNGDGSFQVPVLQPFTTALSIRAADLDGNGRTDLVSQSITTNTVQVLLDGGVSPTFFAVGYQQVSALKAPLAFDDFDKDGKLDAISSSRGITSVLRGLGDGTFSEPASRAALPGEVQAVLADADGDGKLDLLSVGSGGVFGFQHGNGDGTFAAPQNNTVTRDATGLASTDLNGDGKMDAVVSDFKGTQVNVLLGNGDGTFATSFTEASYSTAGVTLADANGDGRPDIICNTDTAHGGVSEIVVMLNNGSGTFGAPVETAVPNTPTVAGVGDFNADGKLDLAVGGSGASTVMVLLGNGDGSFTASANVGTPTPNAVTVGDFSADGKADIAISTPTGLSMLMGNGDGTFSGPLHSETNGIPLANGVTVDFNADNKPDVVVGSGTRSDAVVYIGKGDGTFERPVYVGTNWQSNGVAVGDVDDDGKPDIVTPDLGQATVTVNIHQ